MFYITRSTLQKIAFVVLLGMPIQQLSAHPEASFQDSKTVTPTVRSVDLHGDYLLLMIESESGRDSLKFPVKALLSFPSDMKSPLASFETLDGPQKTVRFEYLSKTDGILYQVSISESGVTTITIDGTNEDIFPIDLLNVVNVFNDIHFEPGAQPTSSILLDTASQTVDFMVSRQMSFLMLGLAFLLVGVGVVARFRWRVNREKKDMLASRRRLFDAREDERIEVASALHDGPIQALQILQGNIDEQAFPLSSSEREAKRVAGEVSQNLRDICSDLKPPVLHHFGIVKAAKAQISEFKQNNPGVHVHFVVQSSAETIS